MQPAVEADPSRFAIEGTEGPTISGPSPSIIELIVSEDPVPTPPRTTPRPPEGGRYLTPQRVELMEEALWMNLESAKKKREWRERSIAERKAKRSKSEVRGRVMGEGTYPSDNQAGPSCTASTTPNLGASTPITTNEEQGQAMEVEEDTRRAGKGKKSGEDSDHAYDKESFPRITTTILEVHSDEVWDVAWSHDGTHLASASKDKTAIIWRIGLEAEPSSRDCIAEFILRDHLCPLGCLAWSLDDSILSTSADHLIFLWNTKTGALMKTLENHAETVSALVWLPDGSGFMSGSLDRKIILWDMEGEPRESWNDIAIRVTDAAVTPDMRRLVAIGMGYNPPAALGTLTCANIRDASLEHPIRPNSTASPPIVSNVNGNAVGPRPQENRMIIYDLKTGQVELSVHMEGELTSVKISEDSQYALINHAPDEIHLWDLKEFRLAHKFTGQQQGHHVIRSCFGGIDGNFVISGSEDRNVYVWHRDTGTSLEVLEGHGLGSVNSIAWNPHNERMFASCSDDNTIRVWEAPISASEVLRVRHVCI
ncbi:WD40-repeat-containing domain protein [Suillus plorans]|uniref:WD40-repeat-containing domain protein n=1 Tax=Suillus plorans TaxID=116603 RepID=A0A9P7AJ71_9AGAM|nr:WD40-repeat-containing domain protein [Suillus plorans]KAG1789467.1 WD40-repeat-containing domain protein [Suillus plorans]